MTSFGGNAHNLHNFDNGEHDLKPAAGRVRATLVTRTLISKTDDAGSQEMSFASKSANI